MTESPTRVRLFQRCRGLLPEAWTRYLVDATHTKALIQRRI